MSYTCTICDNTSDFRSFSVKEMQLGMRELFQYVLCNNCQSIQIGEIPRDLGKSLEGIKIMLDNAGLHHVDMYCDSRDEQFFVSENYSHDISMNEAKKSPVKSMLNVLFSGKRASYRKEARRLNNEMKGDTVVYYSTK